jgi:transposase
VKEKSPKKKKIYSEEFRLEAVNLSNKIGYSKAANELNIHESSIRIWKKSLENPSVFSLKSQDKKSYSDLEKEIKRLAKENGYLKEINRVLKKSTAIFSADHMGGLK